MAELGLDKLLPGARYRVVLKDGTDLVGDFVNDTKFANKRTVQFDLRKAGEAYRLLSADDISMIFETNQKVRGIRKALSETRVF